ncbi:hypothetical protein FAM21835_02330 [Lentilactobacillus parabuchneri]|nr:hypothetical protein FAM21835_02330 [Lentilactobacillus parabuchneri]
MDGRCPLFYSNDKQKTVISNRQKSITNNRYCRTDNRQFFNQFFVFWMSNDSNFPVVLFILNLIIYNETIHKLRSSL